MTMRYQHVSPTIFGRLPKLLTRPGERRSTLAQVALFRHCR